MDRLSLDDITKSKRTILVVDDLEMNRAIVNKIFNNEYNVLGAENSEVAINILNSEKIDIVITDIQMPEMDDIDLIKEIRKLNNEVIKMQ